MAARLESIMARHERWEQRTLADLRAAGFERINSIMAAKDRLATQRSMAGFSQQQIDVVQYAIDKARREGRRHAAA